MNSTVGTIIRKLLPLIVCLLTACSLPTGPSPIVEDAQAAVATAVSKPFVPSAPDFPDYPTNGLTPSAGLYKAPADTSYITWFGFPDYPSNATLVPPPVGDNPSECLTETITGRNWRFCTFAFLYQAAVISPDNMVGVIILPAQADGYMHVESTTDNGTSSRTNETQVLFMSDGTNVIAIKMTTSWSAGDIYTYQFGVVR